MPVIISWDKPLSHTEINSFVHHLLSQEAFPVGLLFQPLPQRMSTGPVHIDLTEHVKLSVVGFGKPLDLCFVAGLLQSKTSGET